MLHPDYSARRKPSYGNQVSIVSLMPLIAVVRDALNEPMISPNRIFLVFAKALRRYQQHREDSSQSTYPTDFWNKLTN